MFEMERCEVRETILVNMFTSGKFVHTYQSDTLENQYILCGFTNHGNQRNKKILLHCHLNTLFYFSFLVAVTRLTSAFVSASRLATLLWLRVRHVLEVFHEVHHEPALQSVFNELVTGNLSITDGRHVSDV